MTDPGTSPPDHGRQVAVLADDLTGANDTVVMFAQAGWPTYLLLEDGADIGGAEGGLLAVGRTLDSRAHSEGQAAARTGAAIVARRAAGSDRIYLKIDSTMRGSVRGQIRGALTAWSSEHPDAVAVVCPAYPRMGRTIEGGRLLVNGMPLPQSPAGSDPLSPMRTEIMTEIVPGSLAVAIAATAAELADAIAAAGSDTVVVDAVSEDDLAMLAQAIDHLGPRVLPVGSAGLARHLATTWLPDGTATSPARHLAADASRPKALIANSSLNRISSAQLRHLLAAGAGAVSEHVLPDDLVGDEQAMRAWGATHLAADPAPVVALRTSGDRSAPTEAREAASGIAQALGAAVAGAAATGAFSGLVLVGGDGARAILRALGARALRITGSALEGVPSGVVVGGAADGIRTLTKAGGFGDDETLTTVVGGILGRPRREPEPRRKTR